MVHIHANPAVTVITSLPTCPCMHIYSCSPPQCLHLFSTYTCIHTIYADTVCDKTTLTFRFTPFCFYIKDGPDLCPSFLSILLLNNTFVLCRIVQKAKKHKRQRGTAAQSPSHWNRARTTDLLLPVHTYSRTVRLWVEALTNFRLAQQSHSQCLCLG